MKVTKTQAYIIGGIALVGLSIGAYFAFFRKEKGEYDASENNAQNPTANPDYKKQLQSFRNGSKIKQLTHSLLTEMNKRGSVNKQQVKNLIYEGVPDDEYMKILKSYFHCHYYKGNILPVNDSKMDLVGWLRETLSSTDFNDLLMKYPSLNYVITCK
ncbi:hypothetical protein [Capnocytophaga sp. oral taxon 878]|uniref:hypothetical protein n=1 Tax=Capnocytophaga sp. oral taxon 878 TaxID=1316596 RepID=UPI000D0465CB|nr:hypothetical protein [Capnocytophaga sp. oral taxon 878]AVM49311.1 hypothetical protein C4H12_01830 [Capnocytophaga sp. oral taxon 878]